jgi:myo-inositol-1(or 4)-monophosphatase
MRTMPAISNRAARTARASRWEGELAFASEVALQAGVVLQAGYQNVERITHKSRRDVVTDVDYRSEELVIKAIRAAYPHDAILAEESGRHGGDIRAAKGRTWVIDPLDGTVNYANSIPYYSVSIGLVAFGKPVVGVVLDPARGDLYAAAADGPARLNGDLVVASDKDQLADYVVSLAIIGRGGIGRERRIARRIRIARRMGSFALSLAYVASGRFDAVVQNGGLSLWDVAAAGLIAERAGATVTDLEGGAWWDASRASATVSIVAAPQPQHRELLALLRGVGASVQTRRP